MSDAPARDKSSTAEPLEEASATDKAETASLEEAADARSDAPIDEAYAEDEDLEEDKPRGATIEGGVDAIVIGAPLNGLAAAALLAKAGLRTVIVESELPMTVAEPEEFAPQFFCDDGDRLLFGLDQATLQRLDLHRHGLRFVERRMETAYRAEAGERYVARGNLADFADMKGDITDADRRRAETFTEEVLSLGKSLRLYFETGAPPDHFGPLFDRWALSSLDEALTDIFEEDVFPDILAVEAARGVGVRPDAPMTALALIRRFAGEIAGLQSGLGVVDRGVRGLSRALRRAAQAFGADYRHASKIKRVLVEWDRVEGVEFTNGGQIRAPVVVSCYDPRTAFLNHVGRDHLNIEFVRAIEAKAPNASMLAAHIAFAERTDSPLFAEDYRRRTVRLAPMAALKCAHSLARTGGFSADAPAELFFPSAFSEALAPTAGATGVLRLWPAPSMPSEPDETSAKRDWVREAENAVTAIIADLDRDAADHICAVRLVEEPAADVILREAATARLIADSGGLAGYFYCGPGAQIGLMETGAAGRRAADAALHYYRHLQDRA